MDERGIGRAVRPRRSRWLAPHRNSNPGRLRRGPSARFHLPFRENLPMRRFCIAMAGVVLVAAALAGCGGGDSTAAPGSGFLEDSNSAVPFKSTDLTQFGDMQNQMKDKAKKGDYKQKAGPAQGEGGGEDEVVVGVDSAGPGRRPTARSPASRPRRLSEGSCRAEADRTGRDAEGPECD